MIDNLIYYNNSINYIYLVIINNLIYYDNVNNYTCFVIQKTTIKIKISLDIRVFTMKIVENFIIEIVNINTDDIYIKIDLIEQSIIVLLQITMKRSIIGFMELLYLWFI